MPRPPATATLAPAGRPARHPLRTELARRLGPGLLVGLVRACRVSLHGADRLHELAQRGRPYLFAVWHGRILAPLVWHRHQAIAAMVSQHSDGELVARMMQRMGYHPVRGSSTRGGKEAFHAMLAELDAGRPGAVIPDGPRGPARVVKPGIVRIAARAGGAAILPMSFSARPGLMLGSWDGMLIPAPLARLAIVYAEPVEVGADCDEARVEALRHELERRLLEADERADALVGRPR